MVFPPDRGRDFFHQAGGGNFFYQTGRDFFPKNPGDNFYPASQYKLINESVADPGFDGRGGENSHKQGRSPVSRHKVESGGGTGRRGVPPPQMERKWKLENA